MTHRSPLPNDGEWLLLAEVSGRRPVLLLAVEGRDGLCWSTLDVDEAASWLLRSDAAAARRVELARRGRRLRVRVVRRDDAVVLMRWARFGVLADLRSTG